MDDFLDDWSGPLYIKDFDDVLARLRPYVADAVRPDFERELKKALSEYMHLLRRNWPQIVREQSRSLLSTGTVERGPYMTVMNHFVRAWERLTV